jgi:hypothetical protein
MGAHEHEAGPGAVEGRGWVIDRGSVTTASGDPEPWRDDGASTLTYSNPFHQELERVWFEGRIVFAVELGRLDIDPGSVRVAQEYQIVHGVELGKDGKPIEEPERVPGQYNIYDSVPGMSTYSPLWQFNYVVVPRDYQPNTLRSERDCLESGYPTVRSALVEN